ncbi:MAG: carboxyl transferase domain-containing protein [Polyangiaceae bacterium]
MTEFQPIRRLAIVNRGEAAMRCIRAVKTLRALENSEIEVLALYTAVDRNAPFVRHADIAVMLPTPGTAVQSYLNHDLLLRTLERHGVDAVWPGWGFVAEDPVFVDRLDAAKIRFLGPTSATMRALGDKIASKELAEKSEVPVTKWSNGVVASVEEARRHAENIGYPLVIKASAGGGGRGIRVVREPGQLEAAFRSAASEAQAAFGDGRLFMEAMVQGGRHIEVQIVADKHGNVIALGCRDCSVQRRHQKVIEEAPPAHLPPLLIKAVKDSAVELAQSVGYSGVGTVEFLVRDAEYFFLEMNPRLQVEHGITEELTGTELVQTQIRIARGERLPELDYRERGFAIEARVCAEDPDAGFLPAPGRVVRFDPALGPRLRIDTGVASGSEVPADFDSLIAKVIAYGDTREEARARLACALRDFDLVIEGGATNKGYLLELLEAEDYKAGGVDTLWLDRWNAERKHTDDLASEGLILAALLSYQVQREVKRLNFYADAANITPEKIPPSLGQEIDLTYLGKPYRVRVFASGSWQYRVHLEDRVVAARINASSENAARLVIGDRDLRVLYDITDTNIRVEIEGRVHSFGRQTAGQVCASAPSMVVALHVSLGQRVEAGQQLGLVEAMKMEIGFDSPVAGTVKEIRARKGQQVAAGDVILVIDPASEEGDAAASTRLALPVVEDSLALLFSKDEQGKLAEPNLARAAAAPAAVWRRAMDAVDEEVLRIMLGYDAFDERVERLIGFLEAPIPDTMPPTYLKQLAEVKRQLGVFADIERIFTRRRAADDAGSVGASNNARMRLYVRRLRAGGAELPTEFLDNLKRALGHYGVDSLDYSVPLERAVLRLFASQGNPELRFRLVRALLKRVMQLVDAGFELDRDADLRLALSSMAQMRGQIPDDVADAAIDAAYTIFERPELSRQAERTSRGVEQWLERSNEAIDDSVLADLALAPSGVFRQVKQWLRDAPMRQRGIALSACIRRNYAPKQPSSQRSKRVSLGNAEVPVTRLEFAGSRDWRRLAEAERRVVIAGLSDPEGAVAAFEALIREAVEPVFALELVVTIEDEGEVIPLIERLTARAADGVPAERFTISVLNAELRTCHYSFSGSDTQPLDLHLLHPEAAERVDFERYKSFELERLVSPEGIYCFHGKSREVPEDERIFVLVDVRGRPPEDGPAAIHYVPIVERAFHEAARTLRHILLERDSRRRLQWNRITLFLAHEVVLDANTAGWLSRKLHPATRHLGLERVAVRLKILDPTAPSDSARRREMLISDITGSSMEILWREPHTEPLVPVQAYERAVVAAKRRGLVYPYEIIRMLAPDGGPRSVRATERALPSGTFEEYDLDPQSKAPKAVSVDSRPYGQNQAGVVFGVISTPTKKVPEGMKRVLVLSDPTRDMGALSGPECDRVIAALDLAQQLQVPLEWIPVSSGAKIAMDSGTENLDATARVVRRIVTFTQAGGVIHIIVAGVNVGAQSYWDALSTMLLHTRGVLIMTPRSSMVLTGRAALAASGSVSAEDEVAIGGHERIMGPNGQGQYFASDLKEAFRILYEHYSYTYVVPGEQRPRELDTTDPADRRVTDAPYQKSSDTETFERVGEIFDDATNPGRKKPFSMRALMSAVIDQDGGFLERWKNQVGAETAIVWDAHLGGQPVCLIGIESQNVPRYGYRPLDGPAEWNGGTLFPQSSRKVSRALNSASGNRPVVILANLSGFDGSPESMRKFQLEYGAEIARAVVNFKGPILFLVVSRYHGGAYVVFSRELNPSLRALALEGSYASVIGGGPAAKVVFGREVRGRVQADPRVKQALEQLREERSPVARERLGRVSQDVLLEKQAEVAQEFDAVHSVERALKVGSLERILPAVDMRQFLINSLCEALGRAAE